MKKLNFRPIFYCAVMFVLALVLSRQIFSLSIFHIFLSFGILAVVAYLCIKGKHAKRFIALFCAFIFGLGYYFVGVWTFEGKVYDESVVVNARVSAIYQGEGYTSYILDSVKINTKSQNHNISLTVADGEKIEFGTIVVFETKLKNTQLFDDGEFNSYYYTNNIAYKCNLKYEKITQKNKEIKLNEKIINNFNNKLNNFMSDEISGLVTCVLFGDKTNLINEVNYAYNSSGMAHLLAVSGMHIMLLIYIISFLLSKIKIKRIFKFIFLIIILTFFAYICNFVPSIVRALIMGLLFSFGNLIGKKYDKLNSLGLCAIVMLLFRPFDVFDAGFVLSFMCVFCIFTLQKPVQNFFEKLKMNSRLAQALSVVVSVQIGLIPVLTIYSQSFNLFSLLINLVFVPIFEFVFVITLALVPICVVVPFMSFALRFVEFVFGIITIVASWVGSLTWANLPLAKFNDTLILSTYTSVFVCSGYVNLKRYQKAVICCLVMAVGFLGTFVNTLI